MKEHYVDEDIGTNTGNGSPENPFGNSFYAIETIRNSSNSIDK